MGREPTRVFFKTQLFPNIDMMLFDLSRDGQSVSASAQALTVSPPFCPGKSALVSVSNWSYTSLHSTPVYRGSWAKPWGPRRCLKKGGLRRPRAWFLKVHLHQPGTTALRPRPSVTDKEQGARGTKGGREAAGKQQKAPRTGGL